MKRLLLFLLPLLAVVLAFAPGKTFTVNGKIADAAGTAVVGVSVTVKGTAITNASGADGSYHVDAPNKNGTLVFSAVGFDKKEVRINGRPTIDITLDPLKQHLNEVVVTAIGMSKRKSVPGSVASIANRNNPGLVYDQLQGKAPGIVVGKAAEFADQDEKEEDFNTEGYDHITENRFLEVKDNPLSTFSIDVDAASYSNVRRYLNMGQLPPAGAVRIEEMVNYFHYEYPAPQKADPFSVNAEIAVCPWNNENKLVLVSLQGKKIPTANLPSSNLVFLIDVSGSMLEPQKLPLVQASLKMLVDQLRAQDHVAMVVYAGAAGLVLPSTSGAEKIKIKDAIDKLQAGGSTAGGEGIKLAYKTARANFDKEGNNRVILCTDGDFNVGASSDDEMERLIEQERKSGVFLTVLGYGMGNYKDSKMQKLADKGNGNHAYIDGITEAKKVLVNEFGGTLFTIAKDVKLQIEFNPEKVQGYRLLGYENRILQKEDFNNDQKDAGDMGSGHTVTALYEVIPAGRKSAFLESVDPLKYPANKRLKPLPRVFNGELMNIKLRYKEPAGDLSKLMEYPVPDANIPLAKTSDNFRFAASVAQFGMLLRNSEFKSKSSFANVLELARRAKGNDEEGYRSEFIRLVEAASSLASNHAPDKDEDVSVRNYYRR